MKTKMKNDENAIGSTLLIPVRVGTPEGHTDLLLTPAATVELAKNSQDSWLYLDSIFVDIRNIADIDWTLVSSVEIAPGITGGSGDAAPVRATSESIIGE